MMYKNDKKKFLEGIPVSTDSQLIPLFDSLRQKPFDAEVLATLLGRATRITESDIADYADDFFRDLQGVDAAGVIAHFLKTSADAAFNQRLAAVCWQSRLDFSPHMEVFLQKAIDGSYQMAVECFSVVEEASFNSTIAENRKKAQWLNNQLAGLDADKTRLLQELCRVLYAG